MHFLNFSFPLLKTIKYIDPSFEQADKPRCRMTTILRSANGALRSRGTRRPAPLAVDSMGLRARPGAPPLVVRANSIQYNARPAYLNRQVNRQSKIHRGQQTMIIFT